MQEESKKAISLEEIADAVGPTDNGRPRLPMGEIAIRLKGVVDSRKGHIAVCLCLLVLLAMLPIRMNVNGNEHIPCLRDLEALVQNYCSETLPKIIIAHGVTRLVGGALSVAQDVHIPIINAAPGKVLSGVHNTIRELGTTLLICIGIVSAGSLLVGMLTFFAVKLLLPAALFLRILHNCRPTTFAWAERVSTTLCKTAILAWLFLPTVALVNGYVQSSYLEDQYSAQMRTIEEEMVIFNEATIAIESHALPSADSASLEGESTKETPEGKTEAPGLFERGRQAISDAGEGVTRSLRETSDAINPLTLGKKMFAKVSQMADAAGNVLERLIQVTIMFVITTVVIPAALFLLFILIFRSLGVRR